MRGNISVAIVDMVNSTAKKNSNGLDTRDATNSEIISYLKSNLQRLVI